MHAINACEGATAPLILTSALDGGKWSPSYPRHFSPRETVSGTHFIGAWVSPTASVDITEEGKFSNPAETQILDHPAHTLVAIPTTLNSLWFPTNIQIKRGTHKIRTFHSSNYEDHNLLGLTPSRLIEIYNCRGLQSSWNSKSHPKILSVIKETWSTFHIEDSQILGASIHSSQGQHFWVTHSFHIQISLNPPNLKAKAVSSFERLTNFHNPTWHHIPEERILSRYTAFIWTINNPKYKIIKRNYKATSSHKSLPPSTTHNMKQKFLAELIIL